MPTHRNTMQQPAAGVEQRGAWLINHADFRRRVDLVAGPRLGAIYRLNDTTGEYVDQFEHERLRAHAPMGINYLHGHLFVTAAESVLRFNALTGEFYGVFASQPNVLSRPRFLLWH